MTDTTAFLTLSTACVVEFSFFTAVLLTVVVFVGLVFCFWLSCNVVKLPKTPLKKLMRMTNKSCPHFLELVFKFFIEKPPCFFINEIIK